MGQVNSMASKGSDQSERRIIEKKVFLANKRRRWAIMTLSNDTRKNKITNKQTISA
jgi:hypothetical protein